IAHSPEDAANAARAFGFPVVLKILSPDISHKSDVGGVALGVEPEGVQAIAARMQARIVSLKARARRKGLSIEPMIERRDATELILGMSEDSQFGPVILFGQGGVAVEQLADRALALPPLNLALARATIEQTRVFHLLRGYRDRKAADLD